jgi:hypothetical protein
LQGPDDHAGLHRQQQAARAPFDRGLLPVPDFVPSAFEQFVKGLDVIVATNKTIDLVFSTRVFKLKRDMQKQSRASASSPTLRQIAWRGVNDETPVYSPTTLCSRSVLAGASAAGAIYARIEVWIMLKSLSSQGENGILVPAVTGKFASKADKSTRRNESAPAKPAIHKIKNRLVLKFIGKSSQKISRRPNTKFTRRAPYTRKP